MGKKVYEKNDNTSVQRPKEWQIPEGQTLTAEQIQQILAQNAKAKEQEAQMMAKKGYIWNPVDKKWNFTGTISDAGGEPSTDTRTAAERNRDYWHWGKGANERWRVSWDNNKNPVRAALDTGLGYANPALAGINASYDIATAIRQLNSPQGVSRTWNALKNGNFGEALTSAAGNAMAFANLIPGLPSMSPTTVNTKRLYVPSVPTRPRITTGTTTGTTTRTTPALLPNLRRAPIAALPAPPPTVESFNNYLQNLISTASSQDKPILESMLNGDWSQAQHLSGVDIDALMRAHPDNKHINIGGGREYGQLIVIQMLRNALKNGGYPDPRFAQVALGTNFYDDNPLYQELSGVWPSSMPLLPASTRNMFSGTWDPANNQLMQDLIDSGRWHLAPQFHPYWSLRGNFDSNTHLPLEYRHIDTGVYDGSYPLEYYKGINTPTGLTNDQLLQFGLLGDVPGLFTNEQLAGLSQDAFNNFLKRSWKQGVSGGHGVYFWGMDHTDPKNALEFLISRNSKETMNDMKHLMYDMQRSQKAGYVNVPHTGEYSIDSWPIWEAQSLKQRHKTTPIASDFLRNSDESSHFMWPQGNTPYTETNDLGFGNRIEASPELLDYLAKNKGLSRDDFDIQPASGQTSNVLHNGINVGTITMLSSDEALAKFNEQRKRLYRKDPSQYPGDAIPGTAPYQYFVPFVPTQVRKKGGKLNVRLVKRNQR